MSSPAFLDYTIVKQAPFKRLRMRHRKIIRHHAEGHSNAEIAKMMDVSYSHVSTVLNSDIVRPILTALYEQHDKDLRALYPLAIESMRSAMLTGDHSSQLKAADLYFKTQGKYDKVEEKENTAENIIELILNDAGDAVRRIRYTEKKFLSSGVQNPDSSGAIDVTPTT